MKVLSLDPSLRAFGWALIDNKKLVDCGCIITSSEDKDTVAIANLCLGLKGVIEKYKPDLILFEISIGSKSSRANQSLSYVKALVVSAAILLGIPYEDLRAKDIKKALTGNLNAEKDEIVEKVRKKFKNFDKITNRWSKTKIYAASDAAAVWMAKELKINE